MGAALHIASREGYHDIVKLLLRKGADMQVRWKGRTALQIASDSDKGAGPGYYKAVIKLLLSHEQNTSDSQEADDIGESPDDTPHHEKSRAQTKPEVA